MTFTLRTLLLALALGGYIGPARAQSPAGSVAFGDNGRWQNDAGETLTLAAVPGRVRVVTMFYSGCHMACPVTVESLQWIEKQLSPAARAAAEFVLITLDPGGDTVADLHSFRVEERLSPQWILLRGERRATRALADVLGVSFHADGIRLSHNAVIVVIDDQGRIVSRHPTLRPALREVVSAIEAQVGV